MYLLSTFNNKVGGILCFYYNAHRFLVFFTAVWSKLWTNSCMWSVCVWLQWLGWIYIQRKCNCSGWVTNLGQFAEVTLPTFGVMLGRSVMWCWTPLPTVERERKADSIAQLKRQQPVVPVEARRTSGRGARQHPAFNLSSSVAYHVTRCGIVLALRARCALVMPPQRHINRFAPAT